MAKGDLCRVCSAQIRSDGYTQTGVCLRCAKEEMSETRRYFLFSTIGGCVIVIIMALFLFSLRQKYDPVFKDVKDLTVVLTNNFLYELSALDMNQQIIVYLVCFFIPFGRGYSLMRSDDEIMSGDAPNGYNIDPALNRSGGSARYGGGQSGCLLGLAMSLLWFFTSVLTAPLLIIFKFFRYVKLKRYVYELE